MKYVLFVCTQNAGRSQMAQAFFERYGPPDVRAESAGAEVVGRVTQDRPSPAPGLYVGRGKVEEIKSWSSRR